MCAIEDLQYSCRTSRRNMTGHTEVQDNLVDVDKL